MLNPNQDVRFSLNAQATSRSDDAIAEGPLAKGIEQTANWLLSHQDERGFWCGELEGDTILESEYLLLQTWLGREQSEVAQQAAEYVRRQQMPGGGWGLFPGGNPEISASVKAYFALKIVGDDPEQPHMLRAREAIIALGGADAVNSFTRFYLALLGQISYDHCPAVPPEMMLFPRWSPLNIYRMSAWSRTIVVPLAIMWSKRPVRELPAEQGISELFLRVPEDWGELRCPGVKASSKAFSWDRFFRTADSSLKWLEKHGITPLRGTSLRMAEQWMTDRFSGSDGLGAIFPPIIWSVVALKCLGYGDESPEVRYCHDQLDALCIQENDTVRLQPCKSPVWDTTFALRALCESGVPTTHKAIENGVDWLLAKEVTRKGDWATTVRAKPGGWFFEHNNEYYPDLDDTAMALMVLRQQFDAEDATIFSGRMSDVSTAYRQVGKVDQAQAAAKRAREWVLAMQNSDGGWGAFDRDNDAEFLCHVPFADHNAMIDPSTPDLTARVLESLGFWGMQLGDPAIDRAVRYVMDAQQRDGAWFGRWGVNYIYGTWQVMVGLRAVGMRHDDPVMVDGARWLLAHQQDCGGWGETPKSYDDPSLRGQGPVTASQTAWALLGLVAAGYGNDSAVESGVEYLLRTQKADGTWDEPEFTGTGFPRVFYLRYHMYPIYFPLMALSAVAKARKS